MTAAHLTTAADHPWTCHHSPCRVSRTSHMPSRPASASACPLGSTSTAVCCASSTSNSSPADDGRGSFCAACSSHGSWRRLTPATGRARLTLQESVNFCSCASSTCAIASESHRIASGTWTRQLCASFQQATTGGPRGPSQPMSSPRAFVTVTLAANMRGGMWTQIVYEGKSGRVHPHGPHFPRQLVSHSPTHWITQEALLDMIDAIDADMHARPGSWFWIVRHNTARHPAAHQTVLRPAELHGIHSAAGPGVHARRQELDPPRGGLTLRRVLLGSRVQLRTCESGRQHRSAPPAAALVRAHSRTERRQPATSNRWLALHRLERGGAA